MIEEQKRKLAVVIPDTLARVMKSSSAMLGKPMSVCAAEAFTEYLEKRNIEVPAQAA